MSRFSLGEGQKEYLHTRTEFLNTFIVVQLQEQTIYHLRQVALSPSVKFDLCKLFKEILSFSLRMVILF